MLRMTSDLKMDMVCQYMLKASFKHSNELTPALVWLFTKISRNKSEVVPAYYSWWRLHRTPYYSVPWIRNLDHAAKHFAHLTNKLELPVTRDNSHRPGPCFTLSGDPLPFGFTSPGPYELLYEQTLRTDPSLRTVLFVSTALAMPS